METYALFPIASDIPSIFEMAKTSDLEETTEGRDAEAVTNSVQTVPVIERDR